ncbi:hypothetical protein IKE07_01205 [Candidatus Saccharibacteria bacterium]|nr:hypothetical protein [Candidatus Saccharibacteria bacterium]
MKIEWHKEIEELKSHEKILLVWTIINIGGEIIVLEEDSDNLSPDLIVDNIETELKYTSGNLNTLDSHVRKAAKQTEGRRLVLNISSEASYSNEDAINTISRRMFRSNLREVYLLKDYQFVSRINLYE